LDSSTCRGEYEWGTFVCCILKQYEKKEGKAMKEIFIICGLIVFFASSVESAEEPIEPKKQLVVANEKEGVYLYATPNSTNDLFTDFVVKIGNKVVETYRWQVERREERKPELHVVDLNNDGKKEVVVIFTLGTGTWVVQKEAHILQLVDTADGKDYEEMDIDNPVHKIEREFKITATDKKIWVKGIGHLWRAANTCGKTNYRHRFPLHQSVNWKVEGNNLVAEVGLTITNNCVPGSFVLKYKQRREIYVAKQIEVRL